MKVSIGVLSFMLSVAFFIVILCRDSECKHAECHYAQCRYAECRGSILFLKIEV
jgi:hypothetical protein